ncbi:Flotillin-like protein 1 [Linum perenne]
MTMEEIFRGTKEFKHEVFGKVQLELNQFGLYIYNANVKQLVDIVGHEYFSYLGQKTQMEAANQAKVDVAEARMKGEIGAKERDGLTIQNAVKIETKIIAMQRKGEGQKEEINVKTNVKIYENLREAEVAEANAELAKKKAGWSQASRVAEVESNKVVALRDAELQREVERMNAQATTGNLKADLLTKATVQYETRVQEANAELYKKQEEEEAVLFAKQQAADAELYFKQKEVGGIM